MTLTEPKICPTLGLQPKYIFSFPNTICGSENDLFYHDRTELMLLIKYCTFLKASVFYGGTQPEKPDVGLKTNGY